MSDVQIGFVGQGYIGKSYADDFEDRGFSVVRYSLEEPFVKNKDKIAECDIVFIAVPTPTTGEEFDDSIVRNAITEVSSGSVVVIKSTLVPGTTESIQKQFPDRYVMHSPEFLSKKTADYDARNPRRNIIGIPIDNDEFRDKAAQVLRVLPDSPYTLVCGSKEAEIIKYANNTFFYTKVVYMNLLYNLVEAHGLRWEDVKEAMVHEPWIGEMHVDPIHKTGRGAGGCCFIKDFSAFAKHYKEHVEDSKGHLMFDAIEKKNIELLLSTEKDLDELQRVYGSRLEDHK